MSHIRSTAIVSTQTFGALAAVFTIDQLSRRPLTLTSVPDIRCAMAGLKATISVPSDYAASIATVVALNPFNLFFPLVFLGLSVLSSSTIASFQLQARISDLPNSMTCLINLFIVKVTPPAFERSSIDTTSSEKSSVLR